MGYSPRLAVLVIGFIAPSALAQTPVVLRFESARPAFSEQLQGLSDAINPIGKGMLIEVPKFSGRYKTDEDVVRAVQNGQIEAGVAPLSAILRDPASAYDRVPGLSLGYDAALRADRAFRPGLNEAVQSNIQVLFTMPGPALGLVARNEIKSLKDLNGKKFGASSEVTADFARAIGAIPVRPEAGVLSMVAEQFDATLAPPAAVIGLKGAYYIPINVLQPIRAVFINREVAGRLTESQRATLNLGSRLFEREVWAARRKEAQDALAALAAGGIKVLRVPYQVSSDLIDVGKVIVRNILSGIMLSEAQAALQVPPARDCQLMKVIFATNRKRESGPPSSSRVHYGYEPSNLSYGVAEVGLPYRYDRALEKDKSCGNGPIEDAAVLSGRVFSQAEYVKLVLSIFKQKADAIFPAMLIHGYANNFDQAVLGAGSVIRDMAAKAEYGLAFSWPSYGSTLPHIYLADEKRVESAYQPFRHVMSILAAPETERLSLIAHSMGSRVVVGAFNGLPQGRQVDMPLIFVAPDVDSGEFARIQNRITQNSGKPYTIYASDNDLALRLSKTWHQEDRVGLISGKPFSMEPFDLIDISSENRSTLAHSYLEIEPAVISDVRRTIETGLKADARSLSIRERAGQKVYSFRK